MALKAVTRGTHASRLCFALVFAVLTALCLFSPANAQTVINYPSGFASSSGQIWLENFATLDGSVIHLVPSRVHNGSNAWFETPENVQAFTTTFTFHIDCSADPSNCGGGFGFMMICNCMGGNPVYNPSNGHPGYTYSGYSGAQFSWSQCEQPLTPASSYCFNNGSNGNTGTDLTQLPDDIIVTFNNYYNGNPGAAGVSLTTYATNGVFPAAPVTPENDMAPSGINLNSGDLFRATLSYDGITLTESLTDTVTGATYIHTYAANIPAAITGNTAFIGFGGGTGAALDDVYIHSWTYTVQSPGQAASPTFSPTAGTYSGSQSVTVSSLSSGAVICYSTSGSPATNGSSGCSSGTLYSGPIAVPSSETLNAVAGGGSYKDSAVASANYVIQTAVDTPTFSPAAGNYASAQSVTISDATSNASIYYTTNGTTPTTSSTPYSGPILVSGSEKLEAIAAATGDANSAVATASYTITPLAPAATPAFTPSGGAYNSAQLVTISDATAGATIYYTTDGSTPNGSSTEYAGPVPVAATETLKAIATAAGNSNSSVGAASYTIDTSAQAAALPTFSPAAGTYTSTQSVTISDATPGATIYYTTNGGTPSTSSTEYSGPVPISSTEILNAVAVAMGESNSGVASAAYTIQPVLPVAATPTFSPAAGAYTAAQSITIGDATSGATIYYTTNGSIPSTSSPAYTGPVKVNSTEILQAMAVAAGEGNSGIASAAYTIGSSIPSVATPSFAPAAGLYPSSQSVTISDATGGAVIYFTTDGTTPTTSSNVYSGPIAVSQTETVQAIASASGESAVASASYTITAQPKFTVGTSVNSLTLNSGSQGTVVVTITPENGFNAPVVLTCSGLPSWATCSFGEATVTPSGAAATTQLTIAASAQTAFLRPGLPLRQDSHAGPRSLFPYASLALTVCCMGWRSRRGWWQWLVITIAFAGLGIVSGCNGATGSNTAQSPNAAQTSTVTVTAISGTMQGSAVIALTVN